MKAPVLVRLNTCGGEYALVALFVSLKCKFGYLLLGVERKCEDREFQFVSAQLVFLQAGQTAANQQEIHLQSLCARVQQTIVQRWQVPVRHIFRT